MELRTVRRAAPPEVDEQKAPEARREGIDLDSSPASD